MAAAEEDGVGTGPSLDPDLLMSYTFGQNELPPGLWLHETDYDTETDPHVPATELDSPSELRVRRAEVMHAMERCGSHFKLPIHPKKVTDTFVLLMALENTILFTHLTDLELNVVADAMAEICFPKGTVIHEQDQPAGDAARFHVIMEGQCASILNGKQMKVLGVGDTIGSRAMLHNKLYATTVEALSEVRTFSLSSKTYKRVLTHLMHQKHELHTHCLSQTFMGKHLPRSKLVQLVDALEVQKLEQRHALLQPGVGTSCLRIVLNGEVAVSHVDDAGHEEEVCRLADLCIVGEAPFLTGQPSTVVVRALTEVRTVVLDRKAFELIVDSPDTWLAEQLAAAAEAEVAGGRTPSLPQRAFGVFPNGLQSVLEVEPAETEVGAGRDAKLPTPTSIAAFKADLKLALPKSLTVTLEEAQAEVARPEAIPRSPEPDACLTASSFIVSATSVQLSTQDSSVFYAMDPDGRPLSEAPVAGAYPSHHPYYNHGPGRLRSVHSAPHLQYCSSFPMAGPVLRGGALPEGGPAMAGPAGWPSHGVPGPAGHRSVNASARTSLASVHGPEAGAAHLSPRGSRPGPPTGGRPSPSPSGHSPHPGMSTPDPSSGTGERPGGSPGCWPPPWYGDESHQVVWAMVPLQICPCRGVMAGPLRPSRGCCGHRPSGSATPGSHEGPPFATSCGAPWPMPWQCAPQSPYGVDPDLLQELGPQLSVLSEGCEPYYPNGKPHSTSPSRLRRRRRRPQRDCQEMQASANRQRMSPNNSPKRAGHPEPNNRYLMPISPSHSVLPTPVSCPVLQMNSSAGVHLAANHLPRDMAPLTPATVLAPAPQQRGVDRSAPGLPAPKPFIAVVPGRRDSLAAPAEGKAEPKGSPTVRFSTDTADPARDPSTPSAKRRPTRFAPKLPSAEEPQNAPGAFDQAPIGMGSAATGGAVRFEAGAGATPADPSSPTAQRRPTKFVFHAPEAVADDDVAAPGREPVQEPEEKGSLPRQASGQSKAGKAVKGRRGTRYVFKQVAESDGEEGEEAGLAQPGTTQPATSDQRGEGLPRPASGQAKAGKAVKGRRGTRYVFKQVAESDGEEGEEAGLAQPGSEGREDATEKGSLPRQASGQSKAGKAVKGRRGTRYVFKQVAESDGEEGEGADMMEAELAVVDATEKGSLPRQASGQSKAGKAVKGRRGTRYVFKQVAESDGEEGEEVGEGETEEDLILRAMEEVMKECTVPRQASGQAKAGKAAKGRRGTRYVFQQVAESDGEEGEEGEVEGEAEQVPSAVVHAQAPTQEPAKGVKAEEATPGSPKPMSPRGSLSVRFKPPPAEEKREPNEALLLRKATGLSLKNALTNDSIQEVAMPAIPSAQSDGSTSSRSGAGGRAGPESATPPSKSPSKPEAVDSAASVAAQRTMEYVASQCENVIVNIAAGTPILTSTFKKPESPLLNSPTSPSSTSGGERAGKDPAGSSSPHTSQSSALRSALARSSFLQSSLPADKEVMARRMSRKASVSFSVDVVDTPASARSGKEPRPSDAAMPDAVKPPAVAAVVAVSAKRPIQPPRLRTARRESAVSTGSTATMDPEESTSPKIPVHSPSKNWNRQESVVFNDAIPAGRIPTSSSVDVLSPRASAGRRQQSPPGLSASSSVDVLSPRISPTNRSRRASVMPDMFQQASKLPTSPSSDLRSLSPMSTSPTKPRVRRESVTFQDPPVANAGLPPRAVSPSLSNSSSAAMRSRAAQGHGQGIAPRLRRPSTMPADAAPTSPSGGLRQPSVVAASSVSAEDVLEAHIAPPPTGVVAPAAPQPAWQVHEAEVQPPAAAIPDTIAAGGGAEAGAARPSRRQLGLALLGRLEALQRKVSEQLEDARRPPAPAMGAGDDPTPGSAVPGVVSDSART